MSVRGFEKWTSVLHPLVRGGLFQSCDFSFFGLGHLGCFESTNSSLLQITVTTASKWTSCCVFLWNWELKLVAPCWPLRWMQVWGTFRPGSFTNNFPFPYNKYYCKIGYIRPILQDMHLDQLSKELLFRASATLTCWACLLILCLNAVPSEGKFR